MKAFNREGKEVELKDGTILPDGWSIKVPCYLIDGVPQPVADARTTFTDAWGARAGSRPGYCFSPDHKRSTELRDAREQAYDAMVARAEQAWKTPAAPPVLGSVVTTDTTLPNRRSVSVDTERTSVSDSEAAWQAMVTRQENAWRG